MTLTCRQAKVKQHFAAVVLADLQRKGLERKEAFRLT
jgi:hypothetical protein